MNVRNLISVQLLALMCLSNLILGCSILGGEDEEYQNSKSLPPLEVPPDLTRPSSNPRMDIPQQVQAQGLKVTDTRQGNSNVSVPVPAKVTVLPSVEGVELHRDGNIRWLEANADPNTLWQKLRKFWDQEGIDLEREDPRLGIMETVWYERKDALPKKGLARLLGKTYDLISDTGVRDRFRLRLERVGDGSTNIYLSSQRAVQVGDTTNDEAPIRWRLQPANPEMEAEMLTQLMVYLGTSKESAKQQLAVAPSHSQTSILLKQINGIPTLYVTDEFTSVWQRTGVALDRAGLYVEQQDRPKGVYRITYTSSESDKRGLFSRIFGKGDGLKVDEVYQVRLQQQGDHVLITVHENDDDKEDTATNAPLSPEAAEKLLNRLKSAYILNADDEA